MATTDDEIRKRFAHHPPSRPEIATAHQHVRGSCASLAVMFNQLLPESREKSLALTALQEASQWANAAVAIHMNTGDGVLPEREAGSGLPGEVG